MAKKKDNEDEWRRLALQFDGHRLQALWHLKAMLKDPVLHRAQAERFLAEAPLSGEAVLSERINTILSKTKLN